MKGPSLNVKAGSQSSVQERRESQERDTKAWAELVKVPSYQKDPYRTILNVLKEKDYLS